MQTLREKIKLVTSDQSRAGAEKFSEGISSYECLKAQKLEMEKKLEAEKLRKEQLEEALRLSNLEKKLDQLNIAVQKTDLSEVGVNARNTGLPEETTGDTKTVNEIPQHNRERVSQLREYKNALIPEKCSIEKRLLLKQRKKNVQQKIKKDLHCTNFAEMNQVFYSLWTCKRIY